MVPVHLQREGFIHAEHDIMTWTEDRPSDPGEYWLSIQPGKRGFNVPGRPNRPNRSVIPVVIEMDSVSFDPGLTVYFDQRGFGTSSERTGWIGKLDCGFFDGAKWSRRETPADPFEVTG